MQFNDILLVIDCDGVLTDYKCYYTKDGKLFKVFDSRDTYAIKRLKALGLELHILSSDFNAADIVKKRAQDWDISLSLSKSKAITLQGIIRKSKKAKVCFVGNGPEDLVCLDQVDLFLAPNDCQSEIKTISDGKIHILNRKGGDAVLEEVEEFFKEFV